MIKHIYLFKLKDKNKIIEAAQKLLSLKDYVPYIKHLEIGFDFKHAENSYELAEVCEFETMEDFKKFGSDPYHAQIREYMDEIKESGVKIDYEI